MHMKNPLELQMSAELARELEEQANAFGVSAEELAETLISRALDQRNPVKKRTGRVVQLKSKGRRNGDTPKND